MNKMPESPNPQPPLPQLKSNLLTLKAVHDNIKVGYTEYGMYFWIISISVIIGGFFHLAGIAAFIATIILFYWLGNAHSKLGSAKPA